MKFMERAKDGGPYSTVWGFFFIEIKSLFSVALLCFEDGSREAFHSHAFNCFSWVIKGLLREKHISGEVDWHFPSFLPFVTKKETFHKVSSKGRTWVLTFRGPWNNIWNEYLPEEDRFVTLTHGRNEVDG